MSWSLRFRINQLLLYVYISSDQTPTPTKFLKNCEEIGLFNELTKNPFEEAFKKASELIDVKSVSDHLQKEEDVG